MADVAEIRRRLLLAIARAREAAAARRAAASTTESEYERFLAGVAQPVFQAVLQTLRAEGYPFDLATPQGRLRLVSGRAAGDAIEIALDTAGTPPTVVGRVHHTRGRRVTEVERPLRAGAAVGELTGEDVLAFVLAEIGPFVER